MVRAKEGPQEDRGSGIIIQIRKKKKLRLEEDQGVGKGLLLVNLVLIN